MKTVAIVQARARSSRLPGKVLLDLAGKPMLLRALERCTRARTVDAVVAAIPDLPSDTRLENLCAATGYTCFKGSEPDVLDRIYRTAIAHCADVIVRLHGDCPLIDPLLIDAVVNAFHRGVTANRYASNFFPTRTFPEGLDVEVLDIGALEQIWRSERSPEGRERVTSYLHRNLRQFEAIPVSHDPDLSRHSLAIHTEEDLRRIDLLLSAFPDSSFRWQDAVHLLASASPAQQPNLSRLSSPEPAA